MKRRVLTILSILFALISAMAVFSACNSSDEKGVSGEEMGVYYCEVNGKEYLLTLAEETAFSLEMGDETREGTYVLDDAALTLKFNDGGDPATAEGTLENDTLRLTDYRGGGYTFLKKITYTVKFSGADLDDVEVTNGKTVAKPESPAEEGQVFIGWYTDSAFRSLYDFSQPVRGNLTLYARFVENINPEFEVSFNVNYPEGEEIPAQQTAGHKLYNLPKPEREGYTFVGWWFSHYDTAEKLTAQYVDQNIDEPITLYAVWSDGTAEKPAISVSESGVVWQGLTGNNAYTISMSGPDGDIVKDFSVAVANYDYDFSAQKAGDYVVTVTMNGETATAYYKNKGLARVSTFDVTGSTLLFNAVPNATNYLVSVNCGSEGHVHTDIDCGTECSFDFSECDMKEGGIEFVVKATAEGYLTSVSETYTFTRTLDPVTGLSIDANRDTVSWNAAKEATSYLVTVSVDGEEVSTTSVSDKRSLDLQYCNSGEVTVSVIPAAFGWASPEAATVSYTKTRLATPGGLLLSASTFVWDEVKEAQSYDVMLDGIVHRTSDLAFSLAEYYDESKTSYTLSVRAVGANGTSLWAPDYVVRSGEMGEIT